MSNHICNVDCKPVDIVVDGEIVGHGHDMYAAEPSSAAGRYQWELNRAILDKGRRAWRESGQGQSRECRVWDERRRRYNSGSLQFPMYAYRFFARSLMLARAE